jgi:hypothetical protein
MSLQIYTCTYIVDIDKMSEMFYDKDAIFYDRIWLAISQMSLSINRHSGVIVCVLNLM